jgi:hypothetical protein
MFRRVKVFRGVFAFRRIAAAYVPALQAQPQMHPGVVHLQTFFATLGLGFHVFDLIEVGTIIRHAGLRRAVQRA